MTQRVLEQSCIALAAIVLTWEALTWYFERDFFSGQKNAKKRIANGVVDLVGNTPLLRLKRLSEQTGCEILAKAEFLNPGGSVKDRVAAAIIEEGLASEKLCPGGLITEGTAGSTGVSLAMLAPAEGCRCFIAMPDDAAEEKATLLKVLGASIQQQRPVSISHPDHFVNVARKAAADTKGGMFADQFENLANFRAHLKTGEEIWKQTGGCMHAFVCGSGTGGTIAGVSQKLKSKDQGIKIFLVDPPGSGLYNKVTRGVMFTRQEAEQKRLKNPFDTITEGVGINRITKNFSKAAIDGALKCSDLEAVEMSRYLLRQEGLFVGSSSAVNCVGAVKAAAQLPKGSTIVTLLCDGGQRHLSKFHNDEYLDRVGLAPKSNGEDLDFIEH